MTANAKKVQVIASLDSKPEYVLIPYQVYRALKTQDDDALNQNSADECAYAPFRVETYVDNPVARARGGARRARGGRARRGGGGRAGGGGGGDRGAGTARARAEGK